MCYVIVFFLFLGGAVDSGLYVSSPHPSLLYMRESGNASSIKRLQFDKVFHSLQIQTDSEELLIIKTRESLLGALTEHVKANHEYE